MSLPRVALLLALLGGLLVAAGVAIGVGYSVEGAYFTRAAGTPANAGVFDFDGPRLLSLDDGNLWLGAGIACFLFAGGLLLAHARGLRLVRPTG